MTKRRSAHGGLARNPDMKVVVLCGGLGTRLREETEFRPKPMVEIGGRPILWHIMKMYAHYGMREFIFCLGYRGNMIKDYFLNYEAMNSDFTNLPRPPIEHRVHGRPSRTRLRRYSRRHRPGNNDGRPFEARGPLC